MAPTDSLSPAGSSTYSSPTMYVGDGTWDSTRNTFLLPNLVGLNFETMRYNGMGNRFASLPQYHKIIAGHGVLAVITFLFIVPAAIMVAQFHKRSKFWATRVHIYLQVLTILLSTVIFTLGWFAVGPSRSFTNPHHGIGMAIYVLVLAQGLAGYFINIISRKTLPRKLPIISMLHHWTGRITALLGFAQVPLGLALYGSPKYTFVLYALWMAFLLIIFFILSCRARPLLLHKEIDSSHESTMIESQTARQHGDSAPPIATNAGSAIPVNDVDESQNRRNESHRSHNRKNQSRRNENRRSQNVIKTEEFASSEIDSRQETKSHDETDANSGQPRDNGIMDKFFKVIAGIGAAAIVKNWHEKRERSKGDDDYSSMSSDSSPRKLRKPELDSRYDEGSTSVERKEIVRSKRSNTSLRAEEAVAAGGLPPSQLHSSTPQDIHRRNSYESESYYDSTAASLPRRQDRRPRSQNDMFAVLGMGWIAQKLKERRERKESEDREKSDSVHTEEKQKSRQSKSSSRPTADRLVRTNDEGISTVYTSDLDSPDSSDDSRSIVQPAAATPVPVSLLPGPGASPFQNRAYSTDDRSTGVTSAAPGMSEASIRSPNDAYNSTAESQPPRQPLRRHSSRQRKGEVAAAAAAAEAATLAAEEEEQRRKSRSQVGGNLRHSMDGRYTPVSVKLKLHNDDKNHVTLRRLTKEEAAAAREARMAERRQRRPESLSSISAVDTNISNRRYRRPEYSIEQRAEPPSVALPTMPPLCPPSPTAISVAMSKDPSSYPNKQGASGSGLLATARLGSPDSPEAWSGMSPNVSVNGEAAAERRRRRRQERSQRDGPGERGSSDVRATCDMSSANLSPTILNPESQSLTPGPRAKAFVTLYYSALQSTLRSVPYESFEACFPLIAAQAPTALRAMWQGMRDGLESFASREFEMILQERAVVRRLNELEAIITDARQRRDLATDSEKPTPDQGRPSHTLAPDQLIAARLAPLYAAQQGQLNAKLQTLESLNAGLVVEIRNERAEIYKLLERAETMVEDIREAAAELPSLGREACEAMALIYAADRPSSG
ncbi:spindle pole protein Nnf1 [Blumeria hordei DH14]|uniref:Spindle pole protein Nnf1 n=1 Tax=Blumeria graminis f. sp. hordei (strain DH14) TaxID=546991 RepID=N1JK92_BLUG1|nr:spindle pole protein Nnf1 [Blumeria hordei DH14]